MKVAFSGQYTLMHEGGTDICITKTARHDGFYTGVLDYVYTNDVGEKAELFPNIGRPVIFWMEGEEVTLHFVRSVPRDLQVATDMTKTPMLTFLDVVMTEMRRSRETHSFDRAKIEKYGEQINQLYKDLQAV